jgi:mannose-1-phosphate guanylyltransferase
MEKQRKLAPFPVEFIRRSFASDDEEAIVCSLVLAGGEGKRLQPFIRSLGKGLLPKQYVNFTGTRSMLEHTWNRARCLTPPERIFTIVTQSHLRHAEVREQLSRGRENTIIVQPENKETGHGILFPLMHIYKRYPNSVVLALPSDHFVWEEDQLMNYARSACRIVSRDPSRLVLLGIKPAAEEPEYGYILPGKKLISGAPDTAEIAWFIEKPERQTARRLIQAGGLWNTMIMAFRISTLFHWVSKLAPTVYQQFRQIYEAIGTAMEMEVTREVYQRLNPVNFSQELIEPLVEKYPESLVVLPVRDVFWSDWGTASRVMDVLQRTGRMARLRQPGRTTDEKIPSGHRLNLSASRQQRFQVKQI